MRSEKKKAIRPANIALKGCLGCGGLIVLYVAVGAVITYFQYRNSEELHPQPTQSLRAPPPPSASAKSAPDASPEAVEGWGEPGGGAPTSSRKAITPVGETLVDLPSSPRQFVGDTRRRVFHRPLCPDIPEAKEMIAFPDREQALQNKYEPCPVCRP
ncbi:MAG: hypothetical protein AUJ92_20100 [Armatimonadetes bacterium CG2_30_59_28]|nr:hypothetical protein [Armatimonadota bacterium]OIO89917.1 MAG: hypothetical protein AUJ92_20100 [Armatimonadetes bacterium CG2_30_59_28]PIU60474.1 MAG: hypothetical protein COS85_24350 [Armatimonadetes bacterium CG07_land_8_20_14_0_80_59_28]PIX43287.1 MAG: hypothetical protein COZ56_07500 [Armatimonadetes bacterium CG_4_8_14_3_um_filter_58_9]PIY47444.1 MAG: hypothetical protein COZ05_05030 [Armatimonadetes bacterium CG_4_10_14_3_um_filter_59_10]PJB70306.1 MAG: hypothetical protein CO095_090